MLLSEYRPILVAASKAAQQAGFEPIDFPAALVALAALSLHSLLSDIPADRQEAALEAMISDMRMNFAALQARQERAQ